MRSSADKSLLLLDSTPLSNRGKRPWGDRISTTTEGTFRKVTRSLARFIVEVSMCSADPVSRAFISTLAR